MHFMFPHVLSTETESNTETTMGFTCQSSNIVVVGGDNGGDDDDDNGHCCRTINLIQSTSAPTIPSDDDDSVWRRIRTRLKFLFELLWQWDDGHIRCCRSYEQQYQQLQQQHEQLQQQQQQQHVSIFLCIGQKAERSPDPNIVPSSRTWYSVRWPIDQLCTGAKMCYRWRGSARDCMPFVAMARFTLCKRIETHTDVPIRIGSHLRLLQSNALVSTLSIRYYYTLT